MISRREALVGTSLMFAKSDRRSSETVGPTRPRLQDPSSQDGLVNAVRPEQFYPGVGQGNEEIDTKALEAAWDLAIAANIGRVAPGINDHSSMVDKGPVVELGLGPYRICRPLAAKRGSSPIARIKGAGRFNTRIELVAENFLIDSRRNFVGLDISDLHCHGGRGLLNIDDPAVNLGRGYMIERVDISGFSTVGVRSTSQDQPYFKLRDCRICSNGAPNTIGVELHGFRAGSEISSNTFWDCAYMIKLAPSAGKGPTSPINIVYNDFTRVKYKSGACKAHIWIVPNVSLNSNAGKGILLVGNKHGNERVGQDFNPILIADAQYGEDIDLKHSTDASHGFVCGVSVVKDCANFREDQKYSFIKTFTNNLFAFDLDPLWGSGLPLFVCEYATPNSPLDKSIRRPSNFANLNQTISGSIRGEPISLSNKPTLWNQR